MSFVADWFAAAWLVLVQTGPYLLLGFFLAGLLEALLPTGWIRKQLGGSGLAPVGRAALVGLPLPLCSCSVLPTAAQLRREGAGAGPTTSFLISTPETGVDSVGITWALMDPLMTLARPLAALATAITAGLMVGRVKEQPVAEEEGECCEHDHDHEHEHDHGEAKGGPVGRAVRYGFGPLMADLAPSFLLGLALAATVTLAISDDFIGAYVGNGLPAMLLMLAAGLPLYVCATSSTPVIAAMMAKGLEPGPALVFLLAGPATNAATLTVVRRLLGGPALWIYLGTIGVMSLVAGFFVQWLYPRLGFDPAAVVKGTHHEHVGVLGVIGGVVLLGLLAIHGVKALVPKRGH